PQQTSSPASPAPSTRSSSASRVSHRAVPSRLQSLMGVLDTFRLDGQVALVTGGSRGLGLQIAQALGEAGAAVAITARREEGLLKAVDHLTQRNIKAMSVVCDISKNDQVEAAVNEVLNQFDHIDVLVNNAGATWGAQF